MDSRGGVSAICWRGGWGADRENKRKQKLTGSVLAAVVVVERGMDVGG